MSCEPAAYYPCVSSEISNACTGQGDQIFNMVRLMYRNSARRPQVLVCDEVGTELCGRFRNVIELS